VRYVPTMIRTEWRAQLDFALKEPLSELVDPAIQVTGRLEGDDLDAISEKDVEALATIGLPSGSRWLHPAIGSRSLVVGAEYGFRLGSTDDGLDPFTGEPNPEGPQHIMYALSRSGRVVLTHKNYPSRAHVNRSIALFVDMAWRYDHIQPILFTIQYTHNEDGWPTAGSDEENAVKDLLWQWAVETDPSVDVEPDLSYWCGAIRAYM